MSPQRTRGFETVQLIAFVVVLGLIGAGSLVLHSWWEDLNKALVKQGADAERLVWQNAAIVAGKLYAEETTRLRQKLDDQLGDFEDEQAKAEADHQKELANAKAKSVLFERGLRDGSLVYHDPGKRPDPGKAGGCEGGAGTAAVSGGDAKAGSGLSPEASGFLWSEAARADDVVVQLGLVQSEALAYYKLAQRCRAAD